MSRKEMLDAHLKIYEGSDNWSALYVDGQLDYVGDHSNVTERVYELLEVHVEQSDSFIVGRTSDGREVVAQTEGEIIGYERQRDAAEDRIRELQDEMAQLRKEFNLN